MLQEVILPSAPAPLHVPSRQQFFIAVVHPKMDSTCVLAFIHLTALLHSACQSSDFIDTDFFILQCPTRLSLERRLNSR